MTKYIRLERRVIQFQDQTHRWGEGDKELLHYCTLIGRIVKRKEKKRKLLAPEAEK